ncbi:MAG: ankyrin repeat domain-containing protein [Spirochaetota bacterium]
MTRTKIIPISKSRFVIWLLVGIALFAAFLYHIEFINQYVPDKWLDYHIPLLFFILAAYIQLGYLLQVKRNSLFTSDYKILQISIFLIACIFIVLGTIFYGYLGIKVYLFSVSSVMYSILYFYSISVNFSISYWLLIIRVKGDSLQSSHLIYLDRINYLVFFLVLFTFFLQHKNTVPIQRLAWLPQEVSKAIFPCEIHEVFFPPDLYTLVQMGRIKDLKKALKTGVNPNQVHQHKPYVEVNYRYFCCGVDIREPREYHSSCDALHLAAYNGSLDMVVLLMEYGADPTISHFCNIPYFGFDSLGIDPFKGMNAADVAGFKKKTRVLDWLQKHGIKPNGNYKPIE